MKRVRITNLTGKGSKTTILNEDGEPITDVCAVEISMAMGEVVTAKLTHIVPSIDVIAFVKEDRERGGTVRLEIEWDSQGNPELDGGLVDEIMDFAMRWLDGFSPAVTATMPQTSEVR